MKNRIITISREFGSGGRSIGKAVAEALGIPCYDNELLKEIAVESGFNEKYVEDAGEYAPGGFLASAFSHQAPGPNNADYLCLIAQDIIRTPAYNDAGPFFGKLCNVLPAGVYSCGHGVSRRAHCKHIWRTQGIPRGAHKGQGQAPRSLSSFLYGYEMGESAELRYHVEQRHAWNRQMC